MNMKYGKNHRKLWKMKKMPSIGNFLWEAPLVKRGISGNTNIAVKQLVE